MQGKTIRGEHEEAAVATRRLVSLIERGMVCNDAPTPLLLPHYFPRDLPTFPPSHVSSSILIPARVMPDHYVC